MRCPMLAHCSFPEVRTPGAGSTKQLEDGAAAVPPASILQRPPSSLGLSKHLRMITDDRPGPVLPGRVKRVWGGERVRLEQGRHEQNKKKKFKFQATEKGRSMNVTYLTAISYSSSVAVSLALVRRTTIPARSQSPCQPESPSKAAQRVLGRCTVGPGGWW
jgi:hypothetical protein